MILSFLYPQFNIDGYIFHNINIYIRLSYYHFSHAIRWNTRTVESFFFVFFFSSAENKKRKNVSLESLIIIWIIVI
ncbi:hypothetical protein ACOSQ2_013459 [Xanthoceras sorbifolium]